MNKYQWTTTQIDDEDFWLLYDLEFKDKMGAKAHDDELMTIDEVRQRALRGEFK